MTDTGTGIAEEDLPSIFSPFYQSRNSVEDGAPGTGLGLSLVHELLKLHNGTIRINSKVNQGTSIFVNLPVLKEKFPDSDIFYPKHAEISPAKIRSIQEGAEFPEHETEDEYEESILIIEDNRDLRQFISASLKNRFNVLTAEDGEKGLQLAIEKTPDVILSDVMMPKMNGIELTAKVKSDERTSHIPLILLTAKSNLESKLEGLEAGADDYIAKPFSSRELLARINNLIDHRKKLAAKFGQIFSERPEAKTILTLDDRFVLKCREVIDTYLSDNTFGVEKMAEEMNLSRTQLFRKLKAVTGISPRELINEIRLQKAAKLITTKADTLSQIAYSVGYNDQSYFAKRFRKKFGKSPTEFSQG